MKCIYMFSLYASKSAWAAMHIFLQMFEGKKTLIKNCWCAGQFKVVTIHFKHPVNKEDLFLMLIFQLPEKL